MNPPRGQRPYETYRVTERQSDFCCRRGHKGMTENKTLGDKNGITSIRKEEIREVRETYRKLRG